jgi:hypothetical protein
VVHPLVDLPSSKRYKPTDDQSVSTVKLMPPNKSTLVGMRGLLLHQRTLHKIVLAKEDPKSLFHRRYRSDTYQTLKEGIYQYEIQSKVAELPPPDVARANDDILEPIQGSSSGDRALTEKEADELLFQRFKTLFFWPAIMTCTR